jgi:hypothetical protein
MLAKEQKGASSQTASHEVDTVLPADLTLLLQ